MLTACPMDIGIGPIRFRAYRGQGWSSLELAVSTKTKNGLRKETAVRSSLRADHFARKAVVVAPSKDGVTIAAAEAA
jgi:hypothetical protein